MEFHYSLQTIDLAAARLWQIARPHRVLAFSGEMGAGKTTLIHEICNYLCVQDAVSSPTFALINEYHFNENDRDNIIYHLDWYRLKNVEEALMAGMEDCIEQALSGAGYCFIEWPEKALELIRPPYVWISIRAGDDNGRDLTLRLVE